jgi:hypothetical protein
MDRRRTAVSVLRIGLIVFVLAWLFGPYTLRSAVPIWLPFVVALGLELQFFLGARGSAPRRLRRSDRLPQTVDRERYGYEEAEELLLVRADGEELWVPYSGDPEEDIDALVAAERERLAAPPPVVAPAPRRPLRQLVAGLAILAALAGLVWVSESRGGWSGLDADTRAEAADRFSAEAARIAEHRVSIRCDESGDYVGAVQHADGVAVVGGGLAYLTPERCYDLYRLAFKDEITFSQTARAIAVLAHEAWHLRGIADEGTTECYALQSGVEIGQRLGLSERTARQMMRQQLAENSLHAGASSEYVVPPECRDGGRLDLHPEISVFP